MATDSGKEPDAMSVAQSFRRLQVQLDGILHDPFVEVVSTLTPLSILWTRKVPYVEHWAKQGYEWAHVDEKVLRIVGV